MGRLTQLVESLKRALGESYAIAEPQASRRASVYGGGQTAIDFVVKQGSKTHPTRAAAVRAYMTALEPDLQGAPDAFIAKHFGVEVRNGRAKCVRL